ncbi:hypothetical protein BD413DRAFT_188939 [Trametes elegans]|nr:hypothetical protein BD413DRAFT_188939 [Trametes elegans]
MTANVPQSKRTLKECLSLDADDLDEDTSIALTSLVTTAVNDREPKHDLAHIARAVEESGCAAEFEPLTVIPIVIGSPDQGADGILDLMARECSAKEVVMAAEEAVEILHRRLQSGDADEDEDKPRNARPATQVVRLIRVYSQTVPRLPQWKKAPKATVESRLSELEAVFSDLNHDATADEGRSVIGAVAGLVSALRQGADEETSVRDLLRRLIESGLAAFPNSLQAGLARRAFASHFRRLVVPQSEVPASSSSDDVLTATWSALRSIGVSTASCSRRPSLATFILLAHHDSYEFSPAVLNAFFPTILSSIQLNIALDEVLSVLITTLSSLRATTPRTELETDLIIPLVHLLPHLASNHADPDIRHYTFRILSLVLGLSPPPARFQLLRDLLSEEEMPQQMRITAIGLLKEAVLEGLSSGKDNIFASPYLLTTFGPIVLRPDPPEILDTVSLEDFLDGPEPLRLVECLGFYYVLLQRDQTNRTGVRDADSLRSIQRSLLGPFEAHIAKWKTGVPHDPHDEHGHAEALQLDILDMWVKRTTEAVQTIGRGS